MLPFLVEFKSCFPKLCEESIPEVKVFSIKPYVYIRIMAYKVSLTYSPKACAGLKPPLALVTFEDTYSLLKVVILDIKCNALDIRDDREQYNETQE